MTGSYGAEIGAASCRRPRVSRRSGCRGTLECPRRLPPCASSSSKITQRRVGCWSVRCGRPATWWSTHQTGFGPPSRRGGGFGRVLLDWMLPDGSGTELCREMRKARDTTPIPSSPPGAARGSRAGARCRRRDYLRKPFAVAELGKGARARPPWSAVAGGGRRPRPRRVRLAERKVLVRGREAPITAREMAVLEVLLRRRGHAVARADILQAVWGAEDASAGSLEVLIGRIRRKLGEVGESLLRTHRGYGYSIGEREP